MINFIEGLLSKIRETQIPIAQTLTSGRCGSYEDYRYSVGKLDGLKQSEEIVKHVFDAMTLGEKEGGANGRQNTEFY